MTKEYDQLLNNTLRVPSDIYDMLAKHIQPDHLAYAIKQQKEPIASLVALYKLNRAATDEYFFAAVADKKENIHFIELESKREYGGSELGMFEMRYYDNALETLYGEDVQHVRYAIEETWNS